MAGTDTVNVDDTNFEAEVLQSDLPVLVDFWAEWCAPCRMLGPTIQELANDYEGRVKVAKLNTDEAQNTAVKFKIMSIPTVIIFKDGQAVDQIGGLAPKERFVEALDKVLE